MAQRVIDILPKEKNRQPQKVNVEVIKKTPIEEKEIIKRTPSIKEKLIPAFLIIIILTGILAYFKLSKAEIEIWPEREIKNFTTKVTADKTADKINLAGKIIPVELFEEDKTVLEEFSSSGKTTKEIKAEGTIRVYNAYSTSAQSLVSGTRFISADGKLFRSIEKITVPGGKYESGKLVPGYVDIKARADKAGPEYNIGPTTFSIPGFVGTDKYTKFYGKSSQTMSGGELKEVSQVTAEDLEKAKTSLIEKAKKECEDLLKSEIPLDFIYSDKTIKTTIVETFSLATPKAELEKFNYQVKTSCAALAFKKDDLENFVKDLIVSQISSDKKINEKQLKIDYSPETINFDSGKIILSLQLTAQIYSDVKESSLKELISGKLLVDAEDFLENQAGITRVQLKLWPFWVKKVPKEAAKIKITLNLD